MKFKKVIARFDTDNIDLAEEMICYIFFSFNLKGVICEVPIPEPDEGFGTRTLKNPEHNSIIGYLPDTDDSDIIISKIKKRLAELSDMAVQVNVLSEIVDEKNWAHAWKEYFNVTRITDKIVVKPEWKDYTPAPGEIIIHIDPGMAFGTGTHPTTSMCLALLEEHVTPGKTLLDVGCGSGILMICAAKLGAKAMTGIDVDPMAVDITRQNLEKNGIAFDGVTLGVATLDKTPEIQYDIICANIIAQVIAPIMPDIAARLAPDGNAILSGIIQERLTDIYAALDTQDLECVKKSTQDEWVALVVCRKK
ncbi:50S ribosomal protein L11 methyltransferase [Desulfobacter hydrogenophilus]|uniref:Ribosomal protein L11 methyltransferase n=1 Tax=Desulfobacter hydrogenophilus TaxID=2291 RepID=A0A328F7J4_9BACT|nr:50S ribosomal protein L11 methyltransferase [Desulfobacter hydrogenophilus]NDY73695.1 50S ribosomal protein L11 methyltransferase [Desulfobacter hydrogenophilus]QBH11784.1 50S ribosomal protein L11 methyltransferase [Desulfobacter hydrogenophilus]RAM00561.1 50S ribosomal protein L11 methyltransferase [Desulfobacter hydrogenophilus]